MEKTNVCFVGHSHVAGIFIQDQEGRITFNTPFKKKIATGKKYIVNTGSVGQPRDGDPRAAYCIYDTDEGTIELKRVGYDIKKAQEKIVKAGLPRFLAERLSLGN